MNINKWRVVKHDFGSEGLSDPWHIYPPGAHIANSPLELSASYLANIGRITDDAPVISRRHTYTEAIAHAQRNAHTTPTF